MQAKKKTFNQIVLNYCSVRLTAGECVLDHSAGGKCNVGQVGFCRQRYIPFGVTNCKSVSTQAEDTASMKACVYLPLAERMNLPSQLHFPRSVLSWAINLCHMWKQRLVVCFSSLCLLEQVVICVTTRFVTSLPKLLSVI